MIVHECQQGSKEWRRLRAGIPTASMFGQILTPGGEPSKSAPEYMHKLLAERIMGRPLEEHITLWMQRGTELEAEAVAYYEFERNTDTVRVGFMTNDERTVGASPDRLVGEEGLLEIKVPSPQIHVGYLLGGKEVDKKYKPQCQGQLWISGRKWLDIQSYSPDGMPPVIVRVERDDDYISKLEATVTTFSRLLEERAAEFLERGLIKPYEETQEETEHPLGLTDEDFAAAIRWAEV